MLKTKLIDLQIVTNVADGDADKEVEKVKFSNILNLDFWSIYFSYKYFKLLAIVAIYIKVFKVKNRCIE